MKQQFLTTNKKLLLRVPGGVRMSYHLPAKPTNVDRLPKKDSASFQNEKGQRLPVPLFLFRGHSLVFRVCIVVRRVFFEILRSRLVGKCWNSTRSLKWVIPRTPNNGTSVMGSLTKAQEMHLIPCIFQCHNAASHLFLVGS